MRDSSVPDDLCLRLRREFSASYLAAAGPGAHGSAIGFLPLRATESASFSACFQATSLAAATNRGPSKQILSSLEHAVALQSTARRGKLQQLCLESHPLRHKDLPLTLIPIMGIIKPIMGIMDSSNIGEALYGPTKQAVLRLLFGHPDRQFWQKEIIDYAGLGSGTVQRELDRLTTVGIITRTEALRQVFYQANRNSPIFEELHSMIRKTFGLVEVLGSSLRPIAKESDFAFVYGSTAKGTETSASDVDLMVIGDLTFENLIPSVETAERQLRREVNPTLYTKEEFRKRVLAENQFLNEVMKGPKIMLIGDENELGRLAETRRPQATHHAHRKNKRAAGHRR